MNRPVPDQRFSQHLLAEDELGAVVRTHIHIEAGIRAYVQAAIPKPSHLPRLTYEARLRLAVALNFPAEYFDCLKFLGDLRNSFGHNLDAQLTNDNVNGLFETLPEEAKTAVVAAFDEIQADRKTQVQFQSLSPKDRFVMIAAILNGSVFGFAQARAGSNAA